MRAKLILLLCMVCVSGCQTPQRVVNLNPILMDSRLSWLANNMSDKEWTVFCEWMDTSMIPYIVELENR